MTVLLLGGTGEARALAARLAEAGVPVVSSLAGAASPAVLPAGQVRVGGFGGVAGMVDYLRTHRIARVVDATHPFAAQISTNAAAACRHQGTPLLRLSRPSWRTRPDASGWHWVARLADARAVAEGVGHRVFLSVGRQSAAVFTGWQGGYVLLRVVEPPQTPVPDGWEVLAARGPFDFAAERALLLSRRIDVLVTKDSGGDQTAAKLDAAAALGIPVVIVARPPDLPGVPIVDSVDAALRWVTGRH
ncbi:cobalt-precorrin-6A reductase [Micropruina sp.]|uniref:cobalt-precorrin-6A reductase n=1 Tax=Micropruina sp. TaxID=2737536 RepID=UPI0039E3626B